MIRCPICSEITAPFVTCTDSTVSGEKFIICKCAACGFGLTSEAPDSGDIGRYYKAEEYVSHTDTKQGMINKIYHVVRKYMLARKQRLIEKRQDKVSGNSLIDIGCGTGAFINHMRQKGWNVQGLEPDTDARRVALEKYGLKTEPSEKLFDFEDSTFDVITLWHVLEHVHSLREYIEQCKKILKDNGLLLIALPNPSGYDAVKWGADWAAWDVPRHLWHFSPESLYMLMNQSGFIPTGELPMPFDAFYVSMLSSKNKRQKFPFIAGMYYGLAGWLKSAVNHRNSSSLIYIFRKN